MTLSAAPASGSEFTGWSGAGCSGTGTRKVTMSEAKEVTAEFNLKPTPKFALKVKKTGTGTGKVESTSPVSPKIVCGTECEAEYDEGTEVTLSQVASAGSEFVKWTGACSGTGFDASGNRCASCDGTGVSKDDDNEDDDDEDKEFD